MGSQLFYQLKFDNEIKSHGIINLTISKNMSFCRGIDGIFNSWTLKFLNQFLKIYLINEIKEIFNIICLCIIQYGPPYHGFDGLRVSRIKFWKTINRTSTIWEFLQFSLPVASPSALVRISEPWVQFFRNSPNKIQKTDFEWRSLRSRV